MEKTFNKIVLSQIEPGTSDLWMRINKEKTPEGEVVLGHSLWWFTSQGWKKLFDFDTRYSVSANYSNKGTDTLLDSTSEYNAENGIVSVDNVYNVYDATRDIGDFSNIVLEKGLKVHVENLQAQIYALGSALDSEINDRKRGDTDLNNKINNISKALGEISSVLQILESRIARLES